MEREEYMTVGQAREVLEVTKVRMSQLLREGALKTYERGRDRRVKWVKRAEVEELKKTLDEWRPANGGKKPLPAAA